MTFLLTIAIASSASPLGVLSAAPDVLLSVAPVVVSSAPIGLARQTIIVRLLLGMLASRIPGAV